MRHVWLDFGDRAQPDLLNNLSGLCVARGDLWTVSDEGRSLERLTPDGADWHIAASYSLDSLFSRLPGRRSNDEADLEGLAFDGQHLWLCGSHCLVRRRANKTSPDRINPKIRARPSRCLLGRIAIDRDGQCVPRSGRAMPHSGPKSLRAFLARNSLIAPFIGLPSKENGLDIEGIAMRDGRLFLGLRGPLIDSVALIVEISINADLSLHERTARLHTVDLTGLGVRDLFFAGDELLILAGPVSSAAGPFALFQWSPQLVARIQRPTMVYQWPASAEKPEGACVLNRQESPGVLVVYDAPDQQRVEGSRYRADWLPLPESVHRSGTRV